MPVTCVEKYESRQVTNGQSADLIYVVRGTADHQAAINAVLATAPATFGGMVLQPVKMEPVHIDEQHPATCVWTGTASYSKSDPQPDPETGESGYSFDTGGGTQHLTQSFSTAGKYAPNQAAAWSSSTTYAEGACATAGSPVVQYRSMQAGNLNHPPATSPTWWSPMLAPDFKGAIGVTQDSVEGVDVTVPVFNFTETHYIDADEVDGAYKNALYGLTGKVNNAMFRGLAAGECLFLGASGSLRGNGEDWEITFKFAASPNRSNIVIGDILVPSKTGWQYMWVRYEDAVDSASQKFVKQPVAVYIENVYELGSFAGLGIGT